MDPFSSLMAPNAEGLGVWVAAILTLVVYSYLLGDNLLYRLAEHLFVGVAAGYAAVVAFHGVLVPKLLAPLAEDPQAHLLLLVPLVLGIMLLAYLAPRLRWLSALPLAFIVGVGAALAVGGAITGVLIPQIQATMLPLNPEIGPAQWIDNAVIIVGTVCTLAYFAFTLRPQTVVGRAVSGMGRVGRWIMILTFGAIFANVVMGRVSLLIGRVQFLLVDWLKIAR
jgi:hypothetical protein